MAKQALRWDEMSKDDAPLDKLILQFDAFNRSEGKTPKTVTWYRTSLRLFMDYLIDSGVSPTLSQMSVELVREYVLHLQTRNRFEPHPYTPTRDQRLSPISVQSYVRGLKAFFNWLYKEGYSEDHLLRRLNPPRAPRKLIEPLTDVELAAITSAIDPQTSWGGRNMALIILFLDTGLRLSELLTLDIKDLHLEEGYAKVMGKGQKERIVPFGSSAQKALMKYIYHFRPEALSGDRVFLNLDGRQMTETGFKLIFRRLALVSGVNRLHIHLLRHTFAVNYLVNGGDVFTLQQILGHTTLEMVRRYVNLANTHVMTQHKKFSPVDKMNLKQINRAVNFGRTTRRPQG